MVLPCFTDEDSNGGKLPKASDDLGTGIQLSRFCCNALTQSSIIMLRFIPLMKISHQGTFCFSGAQNYL